MSGRILVVDDRRDHRELLKDGFEFQGYEVSIAATGEEALNHAMRELPDLIVLDVLLPDISGLDVARRLQASPESKHIPIVIVTADGSFSSEDGLDAGGIAFLSKPFRFEELLANVKRQLQGRPRYVVPPLETTLTLTIGSNARPTASLSGPRSIAVEGTTSVDLDLSDLSAESESIFRDADHWRRRAKNTGYSLFQEIFQPRIVAHLNQQTNPSDHHHVRIRIQTDRSHLAAPFEMMYDDEIRASGEFIVLRHPLSRFVMGVTAKREAMSRAFLNGIAEQGESLRVLLIASNTLPAIPGVSAEVKLLAKEIPKEFRRRRILVAEPEVLLPAEATLSRVKEALHDCKAHIVHYAGHGAHAKSPERSALYFWSGRNRRGRVEALTAVALAELLRGSDTRLVYLSSCYGGATSPSDALLNDDFLGIGEALIQVGVPAVLSFRAPVRDLSAQALAASFYASLAAHGECDKALLHARRTVATNRDDQVWITPALMLQQH